MHQTRLLIGGAWVEAEGGRTFERRSPLSGDVATRAAAAAVGDAARAAEAAAAAADGWGSTGPGARRKLLNAAADALEARAEQLVEAMVEEIGAGEGWARFNLQLGAGMLREAAAMTTQVGGEVLPSDHPRLALALREPVGPVLGIAPWNAPVILGARAVAMPLACGNPVVFKGSDVCPRTHALLAEALAEAGFAPGVVNFITCAPDEAEAVVGALIDHPAVRRINFTGSTAVGRKVAVRAAERLKPVLLELGGKAPLIVLDDADLDEAVKAAAFGAFMNGGQICMSTERIVVVDAVADAFAARLRDKAESMPPLGALVDRSAAERVWALIDDALAKGASLLVGERGDGVAASTAVVDHVTPAMALYRDESFGPVTGMIRARDEEDAIRIANDSDYGLAAAVFTRDIARGLRVARRVRSGICHVNGATVSDEPQMPFGGVGASGYGRFGGRSGIDSFTELRWVTVATGPGHYPI